MYEITNSANKTLTARLRPIKMAIVFRPLSLSPTKSRILLESIIAATSNILGIDNNRAMVVISPVWI